MAPLSSPNKTLVRDRIVAQLQNEHALQLRAAQTSRDEAISEESRPENQYDMHSQEAAYLAEGQARLVAEIVTSLELYVSLPLPTANAHSAAAVGMLIAVENKNNVTWYFLGPRAGGMELEVDGHSVLVLTPQSPFGRELLGKHVGDLVRPPGRPAAGDHRIAAIV